MAIVSIGEMLDRAAEFEERVEKRYSLIRDESENDGVRLLTYYLCRHRRHLQESLEKIDSVELTRVRATKLKYDVEAHLAKQEFMTVEPTEVKGPELLEAAVECDQALIDMYKGISKQPMNEEAKGFVESLVRVEERDIVMLKKMQAMNYF